MMSPSPQARVKELLSVLCAADNSALAMLRLYLDESGSYSDAVIDKREPYLVFTERGLETGWAGPDPVKKKNQLARLTIGGGLSDAENWERLTDRWAEALSKENVDAFHMSEFESSQGEFSKDAGWDDKRRRRLLNKLLEIVDDEVWGFVGSTRLGVMKFRTDYIHAAKMVVMNALDLLGGRIGDDLSIIYALHQKVSISHIAAEFEGFFHVLRENVSITAASPRKIIALQAADLIAYEIRKSGGVNLDKPHLLRYPMRRLLTSAKPHAWRISP